ncbi:MAG: T9SS type A sorting domain-containing protein [Bacteroidetes bacterium]|nr:T9SS type A sorting domain-containing protein [Bacteroidota bacterium]
MKRNLLTTIFSLFLLLSVSCSLNAQVYQFQEGFATPATPVQWMSTNIIFSVNFNNGLYAGTYSAKMKPNLSWLITKQINTADMLQFYCKLRDTTAASDFHLSIEKSTDKLLWTEISKDPFNKADTGWQVINVNVKDNSPVLYLRFYVTSLGGTAARGLCYIDDVSVTKLEPVANDATLTDFTFNSTTVDGFAATTLEYTAVVPYFTDNIAMGGTPNNPSATMTITNPTNLRGTEAERTGSVLVKAPDGVTTKNYKVVFTVSKYIYNTGFVTVGASVVPFDGWTTAFTYVTTTIPMGDHGTFPGPAAFRFIRGQPDKIGFLNTAKYVKSDTLGFWLAVDQGDGVEQLLIEKRILGGVKQTIANITATDMSAEWKEFKYAIKEADSTEIIFTPTITAESLVTRIYMDDLYMTGKPVIQGIGNTPSKLAISFYPNPATDYLTINLNDPAYHTVEICDITGKKIFSAGVNGHGITMDLRNYPQGIYFVTCRSNNLISTGKFIKN